MVHKRIGIALILLVVTASALRAEEDGIPRFTVERYAVEGNTLLSEATMSGVLQQFTGQNKDFGDVVEALEALEGRYRQDGYSSVAVLLPEQELDRGTVRLKVIEGKVRSFAVEGNKFHDQENILQAFPALRLGTTPKMRKLSKQLLISNENPAKKVSLAMINGEQEDELIASLKVSDQRPWNVGLLADNTGSEQTGNSRVSLLFQHHNLFNRDHGLTLVYNTSPEKLDKVNVFNAVYRLPAYAAGDSIDLVAGYSGVDSGAVDFPGGGQVLTSGKGLVSGIKYNLNLDRIEDYQHKLAFAFDYKEFEVSILPGGGGDLGNKVLVHPLGLTYSGNWGLKGGEAGFYLAGFHNEPWGGRGEQEDFDIVRRGANADYTVTRFGANVGYSLPKEYQIKFALNGQYSNDPLVSGEQFGLGGAGSLRGFKDREVAGDRGLSGTAELYSPNLLAKVGGGEMQFRLLGFYDMGTAVAEPDAAQPTATTETIASLGAGLRFSWSTKISCSLDWGYVLEPSPSSQRGDSAVHLKTMFIY